MELTFPRRKDVKEIKKIMEKGLAFFCCERCNKKYRSLERLHKHYDGEHQGHRPAVEPTAKVISKKPSKAAPEECVICMENIKQRGCVDPCGHSQFCFACLKTCGDNCPMCRGRIVKTIKLF
jgi:hypothetical protein